MSSENAEGDTSLNTDESDSDDYYNYDDVDEDVVFQDESERDPEYFEYCLITQEDAENMMDCFVDETAKKLKESRSVSRILLTLHHWDVDGILQRYNNDQRAFLTEARLMPEKSIPSLKPANECEVCFQYIQTPMQFVMQCGHTFCNNCWLGHVRVQLENGRALGIECMKCNTLVGSDNLLSLKLGSEDLKRFKFFLLNDQIKTHPLFQWCPGADCSAIVKAESCKAKRTVCSKCKTTFCFQCGLDYHAPADCIVIKKWVTKCQDDSETANYIQANTKDCPKCMICIEKNGGCNHMQCYKCKHEFCWMCLRNWTEHNREYYECSIYKENPQVANENSGLKAREALKKYLFYYERWYNHGASLRLETETRRKIDQKIHEKVNNNIGTWIDWQYLLDAAALLAKCRYTIKYTYPFAYYMEDGRKELFEYQQAQLEREIENLSWKLEREELYKRGDFENQMDIAEKRRRTLLKDFLIN